MMDSIDTNGHGFRIDGDRITLRDFRARDWPDVHRYASRDDVVRFVVWGPNDEAMTREFVDAAAQEALLPLGERTRYNLAVELKETGGLVGACSLTLDSHHHRRAELGYCFHPEWWGRGIATEAARLLVGFGFRDLGFHRIYATCDPQNIGSRRVMEKAGLKLEGLMRHHLLGRGLWRDSLLLAITEDDWRGSGGKGKGSLSAP